MKKCNVCNKKKPDFFKIRKKLVEVVNVLGVTTFLLVKERRLTPIERLGNRLGYMGSNLYYLITIPITL